MKSADEGDTYRAAVGRSAFSETPPPHRKGWDKALDAAIADFEANNADARGEFRADVKMSITFYKQSPGWVGEYKIELQNITSGG